MNKSKASIPFEGKYNNETKMLELKVYHLDKPEDAEGMWNLVKKSLEGKQAPKALVDLTAYERTFIAKDVRRVFKSQMEYFKTIDKTAFIVTNPAIRMVVKATMVIIDVQKTCGYFKTTEEALIWLGEAPEKTDAK